MYQNASCSRLVLLSSPYLVNYPSSACAKIIKLEIYYHMKGSYLHGWLKQAQGHTDMCEGARAHTQRGDGHPTLQVGKWIINLI